jgi:ribosomal protein L11 methyltransferase
MHEYQISEPLVEAVEEQDWNAKWKASFTGIDVNENLRVLPPWSEEWLSLKAAGKTENVMAINPGAGFGTGTHETTQLCLGLIQGLGDLRGKTVLDFGSGSGILGIAAARAGAKVYCVEIDPLANENAKENAELNSVSHQIQILEQIPEHLKSGQVDLLVANILRPILIHFAPIIKSCLKKEAELVLSGLIETDVPLVIDEYQKGGAQFKVIEQKKNEWRALWLRRNL